MMFRNLGVFHFPVLLSTSPLRQRTTIPAAKVFSLQSPPSDGPPPPSTLSPTQVGWIQGPSENTYTHLLSAAKVALSLPLSSADPSSSVTGDGLGCMEQL